MPRSFIRGILLIPLPMGRVILGIVAAVLTPSAKSEESAVIPSVTVGIGSATCCGRAGAAVRLSLATLNRLDDKEDRHADKSNGENYRTYIGGIKGFVEHVRHIVNNDGDRNTR